MSPQAAPFRRFADRPEAAESLARKPVFCYSDRMNESVASDSTAFDPASRYTGDDPKVTALWKEIYSVIDPEIGLPLIDLGLIYDIRFEEAEKKAVIVMTLTSIGCPAGPYLQTEVYNACKRVDGIEEAQVEIVFSPPWNPREMASEEVQMMLGIF
jgi:metal-sulfur cluster biosynthetic enzyme